MTASIEGIRIEGTRSQEVNYFLIYLMKAGFVIISRHIMEKTIEQNVCVCVCVCEAVRKIELLISVKSIPPIAPLP